MSILELFDTTSDWLWEVDDEGRYTYVSPGVSQLLGYEPNEMLGRTPFDFMPESEVGRVSQAFKKAKEAQEPIDRLINKAIHKQGHIVVLETSGQPIVENGTLVGYRGIDRDVTKRETIQKELKETAALLGGVLNSIPDLIAIMDTEHRIIRLNSSAYDFFNKSHEEVVGQFCYELIGRQSPCDDCSSHKAVQTKEPAQVIRYVPSMDRWLDARSYPMVSSDGEVTHVIEHVRDVTEQKHNEESMLHSQKLESLGVLAGGIAHDFNNILTAIIGNADLASFDIPADSPATKSLQDLKEAALRAAKLCDQMVAYAGKARFNSEARDLRQLISELRQLIFASISKKVTIRYEFPEELPAVQMDPAQMGQVIMNLVANAAEAYGSDEGEIVISLACCDCDVAAMNQNYLGQAITAGQYVVMKVEDHGAGMTTEVQKRLFEPFYSTKFLGRGLGLAAVLGIIRTHRGAITVHSKLGKGSTVSVFLPIASSTSLQEKETVKEMTLDKNVLKNKVVLLIDDEEIVRRVAKSMLERMGCEVLLANDGQEGVDLYQSKNGEIDCVLVDLTMPRLDGVETLHAIRKMDEQAIVILSSGYPLEEAASRCKDIKPSGIVHKPYEYEKLQQELVSLLP